MDREKMMSVLLERLKSKTDEEVIRNYTNDGIHVSRYDHSRKGNINFFECSENVIKGTVQGKSAITIHGLPKNYEVYIGEDVAA